MKKYFRIRKEYADNGGRTGKHSIRTGRFLRPAMFILFAAGITVFDGCDVKTNEEEGKEAAAAFCNCAKSKSESKCLDELKSNYSESTYMSDAFIKAFNDAETCGVTLERTTKSSSASASTDGEVSIEIQR
jgi:hypothetical protein